MKRLSQILPDDVGGGITLLDVGASGQVSDYWKQLSRLTHLIGFEPNTEECERLNAQKTAFLSQRFLPYAIAGRTGQHTLYKTKSIYCWSLLEPDLQWLRRFDFSNLFEIEGTESIAAYTLDDVPELRGVDVDAMKLDTQGLELPILNAAKTAVESAICIETETGFCQNYKGETTFDQVARFMSAKGFGLFYINVNHCVPRLNQLARESHQEQVLWCEAIWMRDFLSVQGDAKAGLSREKAIKALCLYANHGCFSFGLETADFFRQNGLIDNEEFEALARGVAFWQLSTKQGVTVMGKVLRSALHLLPRRFYASIEHALSDLYHVPHPFRRFFGNK